MTTTITAHFDGKVIVPDEALDLPAGQRLTVEIRPAAPLGNEGEMEARRLALDEFLALAVSRAQITPESLRRENLYEDRA